MPRSPDSPGNMKPFVSFQDASWVRHKPARGNDIQLLDPDFFSKDAARLERIVRRNIMTKGSTRSDRFLAEALAEPRGNRPANFLCCPLLARRFQIFFVDRALQVSQAQYQKAQLYTLFDPKDAVRPGYLGDVDWRRSHAKLRARLRRTLGPHVVALGMGEVEFDEVRRVWQPHYHLVVFGAPKRRIEWLRKKHFPAKRRGLRPMVRSKEKSLPKRLAYMSKLTVFGKVPPPGGGPAVRRRLPPKPSRQHLRYLARRSPTEFVFCMNCRIVKRGGDVV